MFKVVTKCVWGINLNHLENLFAKLQKKEIKKEFKFRRVKTEHYNIKNSINKNKKLPSSSFSISTMFSSTSDGNGVACSQSYIQIKHSTSFGVSEL